MRRRDFIALARGAALPLIRPWPARGQGDGLRRVGVLNSFAETDTEAQAWDTAFRERLHELGWINGRNAVSGSKLFEDPRLVRTNTMSG